MRSFLSRHKRSAALAQRFLGRVPLLQDALFKIVRGDPHEQYVTWIEAFDTIDDSDVAAMRERQTRFVDPPVFSLVVSVAEQTESMLAGIAESLLAGVYERWEVLFVGEPPADDRVTDFLTRASSVDSRFRWDATHGASHAEARNTALRTAVGDFAILVDPGLVIPRHALFLFALAIEQHPTANVVYADEDLVDADNIRSGHYFKPDWNEALLCCQNYLGGFVALRRTLALETGGCSDEIDGQYAWGLFLRMTAEAPVETIHHLPFVLSHRLASQQAPVSADDSDRERGARGLEDRLARLGRRVRVHPVGESSYRTQYALPAKPPTVSVIVPTSGDLGLLRPCLDGLLHRTSYPDREVLVVTSEIENDEPERRDYLEFIATEPQVRVLFYEHRPFNFSWVNNWATRQARGELICFLNDDTAVIGNEWLSAMVVQADHDRVGAVGAMLYHPTDRIQHAGVILGVGGEAGHNYRGMRRGFRGYHDRALVDQDVSCVTAACMLVRREAFVEVGGFDESLMIAFNDVDLCLRLREAGWRIVWTPSAELYHKESVSIGHHDAGTRGDQWTIAANSIRSRWSETLACDPHYSPNLSLDRLSLWELSFPPRVSYPWRVASEGSSNHGTGPPWSVDP